MNSDDRVDEERVLFRGESALVYCADFQDYPEITGGQTIVGGTATISSGPVIPVLSLGVAEVNAVDFEQLDRDGDLEKSVPANKGVKVAVTPTAIGGAKGECVVTFLGTLSVSGKIGKRVLFKVK